MTCSPRSMLDISEGDSASPACTNSTFPPFARSAFTTDASLAYPPRNWPSGAGWSLIR